MNRRIARLLSLVVVLAASVASADELVEKVVVRNRLYSVGGRAETGLDVGVTLLSRLTDHTNLNLHFAYSFSETIGIEVRAGYAFSRHTGLADELASHVAAETGTNVVNDLTDLWEMKLNGSVGVRWAPVYGKLSLFELPVHFQAYVWLGPGGGMFHRKSIVYCTSGSGATCNEWFTEDTIKPFLTAALGLRFFVYDGHGLKVELRDYSWPDSYRVEINKRDGKAGRDTGTPYGAPGITNLVTVDLGYTFLF